MSKIHWIALAILAMSGCDKSSHDDGGDINLREVAFEATEGGTRTTSPQPAVFTVSFPSEGDPQVDLSWAIAREFSMVVQGPYEVFRDKELTIDLSKSSEENGFTTDLMIHGEFVKSGQVTLQLSKNKLEGSYAAGDLTFSGAMATSCSVKPTRSDEGSTYVDDPEFDSPQCETVKDDGF